MPGATVVSVGARPVLFVDKGERSWVTWASAEEEVVTRAVTGWLDAKPDRWRTVRVDKIDGQPATEHPLRAALLAVGFAVGGTSLERVRRTG